MKDRLELIYDAQLALIHQISPVYSKNGFDDWTRRASLDNRVDQAHIKYVAWCLVEELTEAEDSYADTDHVAVEIVDMFHFLMELAIFSDMSPHQIFIETMTSIGSLPVQTLDRLDYMFFSAVASPQNTNGKLGSPFELVFRLGQAMYELKQKPWRITDKPTDVQKYHRAIGRTFHAFIAYASSRGLDAKTLYVGYFDKNKINHTRVQEKY